MCNTSAMSDPNATVRRRRLGMELRRLREQASTRIDQVAPDLEVSESTLSRIERGQSPITVRNVQWLLDRYGLENEDEREALVQLAREAKSAVRGWWVDYEGVLPAKFSTYVGLEAEAIALRTFHLGAIAGLLQTEAYARAMIAALRPGDAAEDIDRLVTLRIRRQEEVLVTRQSPLSLWTVLDEASLRRPLGDRTVMVEQLRRLIEASALPNVTVQVLPFDKGAHAGLYGDFTIIEFQEVADPDVVYLEGPTGSVFIERPDDVRRFALIFDHLRATALSPTETVEHIHTILKENP